MRENIITYFYRKLEGNGLLLDQSWTVSFCAVVAGLLRAARLQRDEVATVASVEGCGGAAVAAVYMTAEGGVKVRGKSDSEKGGTEACA